MPRLIDNFIIRFDFVSETSLISVVSVKVYFRYKYLVEMVFGTIDNLS